jgi:HK97 family phage prohead protease
MTPTTETLRLSPVLPIEAKADPQGVIEGLAATFGGEPDSYGDVIDAGAFRATLDRHKAQGTAPVMLWSHDPARVVGRWLDMREADDGLAVQGVLNLKTAAGREAFEHVRAGDLSGLSIGYRATRTRRSGAARVLTEVELGEVSLVAMPANRRARIREVKADQPLMLKSRAELRDVLLSAGLARAAAEKIAAAGWPALATINPETEAKAELAALIRATADAFRKGA